MIEEILRNPIHSSKTQYEDHAAIGSLDPKHILRIIHAISAGRLPTSRGWRSSDISES